MENTAENIPTLKTLKHLTISSYFNNDLSDDFFIEFNEEPNYFGIYIYLC